MLPHAAVGLLTLIFAAACVAFVRQPTLSTFADDSVSYLVMAQVFSPWSGAPPAVSHAFAGEAFYPPLFPLVLAMTGAAHDIVRAHAVAALLLAACLPLVYLLGSRWLHSRWAAVGAVAVVALLPASWINAKGILSEPLYSLALLAALCALELAPAGRKRTWLLSLALIGLALTRTAGLAPVAAYALWASTRREASPRERLSRAMPAIAAIAAYVAWVAVRPATADQNVNIALVRASALLAAEDPGSVMLASMADQLRAAAEAWIGALLLYWVEARPFPVILAGAVGCLSIGGMVMRLRAGKPDAWMMTAYLVTFLLWPFNDQMGRFLFPALPVLILYAFAALGAAARSVQRPAALAYSLLLLLLVSLAGPAMAFIYQRAGLDGRYAGMTDWYRTPGLPEARARSGVHVGLLEDMEAIRSLTNPRHRVMWVAPAYIALLADRPGVRAPAHGLDPSAYRRAVREAAPDFIFLSAYHPRDTLSDRAWQVGVRAMLGEGKVVYSRIRESDGAIASMLVDLRNGNASAHAR